MIRISWKQRGMFESGSLDFFRVANICNLGDFRFHSVA